MAHHRYSRSLRRSRRMREIARTVGAADALGAGPRGHSARRTTRNVRLDDQELSSRPRRTEWFDGRAARVEELHQFRTEPRSKVRLDEYREHRSQLRRHHEESW